MINLKKSSSRLRESINWWEEFWFAPKDLFNLSLMRIQLLLVMVYVYSIRFFNNMYFYQDDGMVPRSRAMEIMPEFYRPYFSWFFWPDSMATVAHGVYLFLLVLILIGYRVRTFAWLAWILHLGFIQRNYSVLFGADMIANVFLFYLAFTKCDAHLSLSSWLKNRKSPAGTAVEVKTEDVLSSVMYRMIQVHLSIIYAYTGFEKLKGNSWWDGTALWTVFGNPQMVVYDMTWLRHFPFFISFITFLTIFFEIYWPFGVAVKKTRPWFLLMGLGFHLGIALTMGLSTFSFMMLSAYWLWLPRPQLFSNWK